MRLRGAGGNVSLVDLSLDWKLLTILASKLILIIAVLVPQMYLLILEQLQLLAHIFIILLGRHKFPLESLKEEGLKFVPSLPYSLLTIHIPLFQRYFLFQILYLKLHISHLGLEIPNIIVRIFQLGSETRLLLLQLSSASRYKSYIV